MNKLSKAERRQNWWRSHDKIKSSLTKPASHNPPKKKSPSRTRAQQAAERPAREAAQKQYEQQQLELNTAKWKAEGEQLRKELHELFSKDSPQQEQE